MERKTFQAEVKEFDDANLIVTHFISTQHRDRGGDILYAGKNDRGKGMVIEGRPVTLLLHGFNPTLGSEPIAKPLSIRVGQFKSEDGIEVKTKFYDGSHLVPPDNTGRRLYEKTKEGFAPNWSVGWNAITQEFKTEQTGKNAGQQTRHVYEWMLYEYSPVGVSMNPYAQTPLPGKDESEIMFKMIPCVCDPKCEGETCRFEARGDLVAWKNEDGAWEEKPFPTEHSCRLLEPDRFIRIRRENDKFGAGIHAIWGVQAGSKPVELQAIRFSLSKFTADEAKAWLKAHDYKCKTFEAATGGKTAEECSCEGEEGKPAAQVDQEPESDMTGLSLDSLRSEIEQIKTEIRELRDTLKGLVAPEPTPVVESENPPALVLVRDDLAATCAKDAIIGAIREVIGEKIQSEIDRMKGKVK
ncbi:MAG: hypothetical protein MUO24_02425 [Desulfobacterales bacterium]|nr:hypothetical protein [Desulfobacterales bacterium]